MNVNEMKEMFFDVLVSTAKNFVFLHPPAVLTL